MVNYDVAKDIDTHVHRIGRTGRAGEKGTAFTLVTRKDINFAGDLVRNLEVAGQHVPGSLLELAMQVRYNSSFCATVRSVDALSPFRVRDSASLALSLAEGGEAGEVVGPDLVWVPLQR